MKKTIALFLIASISFIGACKKDKITEPETPVKLVDGGSFSVTMKKDVGPNPLKDVIIASAFFYDDPNATNSLKVDCVMVNRFGLYYDSSINMYVYPYDKIKDVTTVQWEVVGNNGVPSFTSKNRPGVPVYTDYGTIPDSISPSKDFTFKFEGFSNADIFQVSIEDIAGKQMAVQAVGTQTSVTFSAAQLALFDSNATIEVIFENNHYENFGGKRFFFKNEIKYYKDIIIK